MALQGNDHANAIAGSIGTDGIGVIAKLIGARWGDRAADGGDTPVGIGQPQDSSSRH